MPLFHFIGEELKAQEYQVDCSKSSSLYILEVGFESGVYCSKIHVMILHHSDSSIFFHLSSDVNQYLLFCLKNNPV